MGGRKYICRKIEVLEKFPSFEEKVIITSIAIWNHPHNTANCGHTEYQNYDTTLEFLYQQLTFQPRLRLLFFPKIWA